MVSNEVEGIMIFARENSLNIHIIGVTALSYHTIVFMSHLKIYVLDSTGDPASDRSIVHILLIYH